MPVGRQKLFQSCTSIFDQGDAGRSIENHEDDNSPDVNELVKACLSKLILSEYIFISTEEKRGCAPQFQMAGSRLGGLLD